jgi:hypothetical protein
MNIARLTLLVAVALLPAACGAPPAPTPAPRASEESSGTWRGTSTRFQAEAKSCPHPGLVMLQIWDDKFQFRWDGRTNVDSAIHADGSILGQAPGITLVGKRAGGRIEGDITNGACGLHFTVVKKDV